MDDLIHVARLDEVGLTRAALARLERSGDLVRVRSGAYRSPGELDREAEHRLLIRSTLPGLAGGGVLSHGSAAVLHQLPLPHGALSHVTVTRPRRGGGRVDRWVRLVGAPLMADEIIEIDGAATTTIPRTFNDLARQLSLGWATAVGDAALRQGATESELVQAVERARRWPGNALARVAVQGLDARSESPGESLSRFAFRRQGLPAPELQFEVWSRGVLLGRSDFAWPGFKVLGEFDGQVKYQQLLGPGQSASEVVVLEKVREDRLRAAGWMVVRWTWSELRNERRLADRIRAAFALSRAA